MPEAKGTEQNDWSDFQTLLDQELVRLPEKYRVPIVLCDLEGKSQKEAALQLGWPQGTVSGQLARGRSMLAKRLARCGLVVAAGSLVEVLSQHVAAACVPTSLVSSTVEVASLLGAGQTAATGLVSVNVVAVTQGVLKTMSLTKLKIASVVLLGVAVLGAGVRVHHHQIQAADKPNQDENAIRGTWMVESLEGAQMRKPTKEEKAARRKLQFVITAEEITIMNGSKDEGGWRYRLEPTKIPKRMTLTSVTNKGSASAPAIYSLEGDRLTIVHGRDGDTEPPVSLDVKKYQPGTFPVCWTLKRE